MGINLGIIELLGSAPNKLKLRKGYCEATTRSACSAPRSASDIWGILRNFWKLAIPGKHSCKGHNNLLKLMPLLHADSAETALPQWCSGPWLGLSADGLSSKPDVSYGSECCRRAQIPLTNASDDVHSERALSSRRALALQQTTECKEMRRDAVCK